MVVLVGVESMSMDDVVVVLRLCFLLVVTGVLIGVAVVGVGNNLETDDGLRRCFLLVAVDLLGVL